MNERLRKLMIQSGYAEPEMAASAKYLAEAIIAECVDAVMEGDRHRRDYFADKIHQHWGWDQFDPRQHAKRVEAKEHAKRINSDLRTYDDWTWKNAEQAQKGIHCNDILYRLLGSGIAAVNWWESPNLAFEGRKPIDVWETDHDRVYRYLVGEALR